MLTLKNLNYAVNGKIILSNQNLSVKPQEHLLLIGPSGCGKTTLMNIMAGLLKPSSGEIIFENQNYSALNNRALDQMRAEYFGFVFQKLHLIRHLNVLQNIALAQKKFDKERVNQLINALGLSIKHIKKQRI